MLIKIRGISVEDVGCGSLAMVVWIRKVLRGQSNLYERLADRSDKQEPGYYFASRNIAPLLSDPKVYSPRLPSFEILSQR